MIKILFVCHGNICRSTLAESVFTHKVNSLGLAHNFEIDSFATSREEIGNPPHYGTVNKTARGAHSARAASRKADYMEGLRARRLHHRHGYREYPQSEPDAEK